MVDMNEVSRCTADRGIQCCFKHIVLVVRYRHVISLKRGSRNLAGEKHVPFVQPEVGCAVSIVCGSQPQPTLRGGLKTIDSRSSVASLAYLRTHGSY